MAISNSAQPMTKREKIKYLTQVLYGLSDSNSRKGVYSISEIAKALFLKLTTRVCGQYMIKYISGEVECHMN